MLSLSWQQAYAWRLLQHCLTQRLISQDFINAVRRAGGVQAQVMSTAELAIGARVDGLSPQDVQSARWKDRRLIKTWAMRAELHLTLPETSRFTWLPAASLGYTIDHTTLIILASASRFLRIILPRIRRSSAMIRQHAN